MINRQWRVARRPVGNATSKDFQYTEAPVPEIEDGQVLLKTLYLGLVPIMRL